MVELNKRGNKRNKVGMTGRQSRNLHGQRTRHSKIKHRRGGLKRDQLKLSSNLMLSFMVKGFFRKGTGTWNCSEKGGSVQSRD